MGAGRNTSASVDMTTEPRVRVWERLDRNEQDGTSSRVTSTRQYVDTNENDLHERVAGSARGALDPMTRLNMSRAASSPIQLGVSFRYIRDGPVRGRAPCSWVACSCGPNTCPVKSSLPGRALVGSRHAEGLGTAPCASKSPDGGVGSLQLRLVITMKRPYRADQGCLVRHGECPSHVIQGALSLSR